MSGSTAALAALAPLQATIERALTRGLDDHADEDGTRAPPALVEAMRYSLLAGGKRLRPLVVLLTARAARVPSDDAGDDDRSDALAMPAAIAIEQVHTYSLIHDDLPAMDDDTLRRGRPTLHVAMGEATAILAGDALLTDAFAVIARAQHRAAEQVRELALAAGSAGMCGGQLADIENEGKPTTGETLAGIHRRKTGRLFVCACALGALAVDAPRDTIARLRTFGAHLGFAFQIADDVLDVIGDVERGGKARGRDARHDKATYVRAHGLEGARALARSEAEKACAVLQPFGARAHVLQALARFAAEREH